MVIVSLLPNALAAAFNYLFNLEVIVHPMARRGVEQAENYFQLWAVLVNSIGFLTGIAIFIIFARPVSHGLADLVRGKVAPQESLTFLRTTLLAVRAICRTYQRVHMDRGGADLSINDWCIGISRLRLLHHFTSHVRHFCRDLPFLDRDVAMHTCVLPGISQSRLSCRGRCC